ncbi:NUDIX hydrolase [Bacillus solimangrovi]|uniref:NTP pyrophosphohydrolase n=1 Tax=Bacillus solimangrovi TaxID=1305675 RepID=A0A1E5LFA9_9BACI|nr:NUDIX domain-containing protein [Bacillus solimangrovi]OEH92767.1 NTP pyrophosphohydrolase [Bacillus solimangrovi]
MVEIFGDKSIGDTYQVRKGVYAVIFNSDKHKIMTVRNGTGFHFLPGGGIESGESHLQCIKREMLEETGYNCHIGEYVCNALRFFISTKNEPLLSDGYFYLASLCGRIQEPLEDDHYIEWINIESSKQLLFHEHHYCAVIKALNI